MNSLHIQNSDLLSQSFSMSQIARTSRLYTFVCGGANVCFINVIIKCLLVFTNLVVRVKVNETSFAYIHVLFTQDSEG